jgi:septum formation protein
MVSKVSSKFYLPLLLVSQSPRRHELLEKAGYQFESYSVELSEIIDKNLNSFDQVMALAHSKMKQFLEHFGPKSDKYSFALTFDTMVEFEGRTLGKPADKNEALGWLLDYSGKVQKVHTGCCVYSFFDEKVVENWTSTTLVHFKDYGEKEALAYLDSEPSFINKAGGYGIQDPGFDLSSHIEGEFSNVVGLPLKALGERLSKFQKL